VENNHKVI
jgi:hypothetical protein